MSYSPARVSFRVAMIAVLSAAWIGASAGSGAAAPVTDGAIGFTRTALDGHVQVRTVDPATLAQAWLAAGSSAAWSPDGSRLAFISEPGVGVVRIRNADGSVTGTGV